MALHLFHKFFLQWSTPWANQLQVLFGRKSTGGALSYRFWQEIPWQPERRSIIQRTRHCTFETLENTRFSTILQRPVQNTVLCAIAHNSCRDRLTINSATPWSTFPQNSTYKVTSPSQEFHHIYTFVEPSSDFCGRQKMLPCPTNASHPTVRWISTWRRTIVYTYRNWSVSYSTRTIPLIDTGNRGYMEIARYVNFVPYR